MGLENHMERVLLSIVTVMYMMVNIRKGNGMVMELIPSLMVKNMKANGFKISSTGKVLFIS